MSNLVLLFRILLLSSRFFFVSTNHITLSDTKSSQLMRISTVSLAHTHALLSSILPPHSLSISPSTLLAMTARRYRRVHYECRGLSERVATIYLHHWHRIQGWNKFHLRARSQSTYTLRTPHILSSLNIDLRRTSLLVHIESHVFSNLSSC